MNTFIKRSMQLGFCALFIGAAVVPACAQKGKLPFKGGKPPMTGKGGAAGLPAVPKTPKTPPVKVSGYKKHQPASTKDKSDLVSLNTLPEDVMPSDDLVSLNRLPERMMPSVEMSTPVINADTEIEVHYSWDDPTHADDRVEYVREYLRKQWLTKKLLTELIDSYKFDKAELLKSREFEEWMSKHAPARMLIHYKRIQKDLKLLDIKDAYDEWPLNTNMHELIHEYFLEKQLAKKFNLHRVRLDEKGFPHLVANSFFYSSLAYAAPRELAAYSENPEMIEVYAAKHPVRLLPANQAFMDFILEQRLNHIAIPITSPARDVLQVAYDYFEIQRSARHLNYPPANYPYSYSYSYRRDVPFEELTYAEKEGFIVHKLINYQLKNGDPKSMDVAHLRMLDYIASRRARPAYKKEPLLKEVVDQLKASLQAYQVLSKDSQLDLRGLEYPSWRFWRQDFKQVLEHEDQKVIMEVYKLLPEELQQEFASTIMRMDAFKDQLQQELEQNAQQIVKELFDMLPSHVKKDYTKNILLKRNSFKQNK